MRAPTYQEILPYIEKKLVSMQTHPEDPDVAIFNYTQSCQFTQAWDDVTRQCRGLIMNIKTGEVVARPFPKFFNYGEHISKGWAVPTSKPSVFEKLDGSLGILYQLNGKPWIATRGSFTSEQAAWATRWWREHMQGVAIDEGVTELFEIVYPENRIVVNYDYSGLVYLASIENATGKTLWRDWPEPVRKAKAYDYASVAEIAELDEPNSEGFVVFYPEENVRMKIKFPEYVRLHKIVTGVSEIGIWEHLRDGKSFDDLLEKVPDEFFQWVRSTAARLQDSYDVIEREARDEFASLDMSGAKEVNRKEWALRIQDMTNPGIGFALLDGKPYAHIIWKMVRPHGQHVFKVDIDS